ncbi:site-specific integrase [Methylocystis echinoides]|uniref:tyrosine-type recombinase/integrase n=1 Tax=Methylocystis echinoides TaxID=29468 RepID=UPI0034226AC5
MPYTDVPAFLARLREREAVGGLALEFTILTAARSGETLGATWGELDLEEAVWTVPAARMKAAKEHRVPLCSRALEIVQKLAEARTSEFVFPDHRRGRPLSNMAMEMLLRRMGEDKITVHGFRSAFRDWVGDETSFPREIAEAALAHQITNEVERAYRRGDAIQKRRQLMDAWEAYCSRSASQGIEFVSLTEAV